ncbi:hypothetical protein [Pseudoalteromonas piscicida]|uniref:hypothetical protein n=1 Tax=Pseudoalteromonas piscicida TaxID=43662 RepID=UPI000E35EAF3|nr:hypothetical protein [Pseudoalteromonas piscicida]AXQ98717.1 hypothetical protein D0N37_13940 [Pseudoalteromonas piscicida]
MNNVSTLSIDLAKNVFQLLSFDKQGNKCFSRRLDRAKLLQTLTQLPACNVVMESCSTQI